MDPLTLALIIGGGTAAAAKLGGAKTSDALKQGVLAGGLSFLPGAQAANPYARALTQAGTSGQQAGLRALLMETAKQGAFQRIGKKTGIDPMLLSSVGQVFTPDILKSQMVPTGKDVSEIGKAVSAATSNDILTEGLQTKFPGMPGELTTEEILASIKPGDTVAQNRGIAQQIGDIFRKEPGGQFDIDKIAKGATLFGVPAALYLSGAFKPRPTQMITPTYNLNIDRLRQARGGMRRIDPITGQEVEVDMVASPESVGTGQPVYGYERQVFEPLKLNQGGIAAFQTGGVTNLPTKITHDEDDMNNYNRVNGYIEDGNGSKDEDTMLAQLADGEFVTRTDGVLGAGIIAGANPKDEKDMREKGAKYFYEQQARFKRIFDLLNENRARKLH